jgi:glucose/arabinose dehydrogenase
MRPLGFLAFAVCFAGLLADSASAQPAAGAQNRTPATGPTTFGGNLSNPSGVAVQPDTGDVFVAERRGIMRYLAQRPEEGTRRREEITGFPTDQYGKGPIYDIGPLGIAFLDNEHLVVGDGSRKDGEELVRIYKVSAEAPASPASEGSALYTLGPIKMSDKTTTGEGNFYGVAIAANSLFFSCNGDDTKGWISRSVLLDGTSPGPLEPFIATKPVLEIDAPVALTTSPEGDLVASQMGEVTVPGDSLLTIYDPKSGELKAQYETGLSDIAGLAYSPTTGKLFAVDFSWVDTTKGALYELKVADGACTATKTFDLDKPTALAFDKQGNLFVTVFGTAQEGQRQQPGKLLRIGQRLLR